jgi:hypothetical protein
MSATTDDPEIYAAEEAGETAAAAPSAAVAIPLTRAEIETMLAPHTLDMRAWLLAINSTEEYPDEDPEAQATSMLASILFARTSEEALSALQLARAIKLCGDEPGGKSPVLEIRGARPIKSDYEEGPRCYCIVEAVRLVDGESVRFTTGSKAVQTVILKHMFEGWMPFKAMLEIRSQATKRGYHPLNMVQGI